MSIQTPRTIDIVQHIRVNIDHLLNSYCFIQSSREVSLSITALQLCFSWLGESLKELGSETPYKESENPASDKIEPQADHSEENFSDLLSTIENTHTARVKFFRSLLSSIIEQIKKTEIQARDCTNFSKILDYAIHAGKEAKFWLGWELNRIHKIKEELANTSDKPQAQKLDLPL